MSKIIIGIHGLGNKPPEPVLTDWWKKSIIEGLNNLNYSTSDFEFALIYWADILHPAPLNPDEGNMFSPYYLNNRYLPENKTNSTDPPGLGVKAREYFDKYYGKIVVNEVLSLKYPSLTDLFIHINMRDLENYYTPYYIKNNGTQLTFRQAIIDRVSETLKKHKNKKILLISHSMGSIITHDVMTENFPDLNIDTLITIGSPLGQKYVLKKAVEEQKKSQFNKLKVPENIRRSWYNLSDLEDQVALNHLLAEIYLSNARGVKIKDQLVQNKYTNNGVRDTHSSYGYLRTPELAEIVNTFLSHKKFRLGRWFNLKSSIHF